MRSANSNADNKPQVGDANNDIASFANSNQIGKYTGEPIGQLNLGRQLDGETQSGVILSRPYTHVSDEGTEDALNQRFSTVNLEDHSKRGSNTIGGVLGDVISMNSDQFGTPSNASERESTISRGSVSVGQGLRGGDYQPPISDLSSDLNASRTTLDTTTNKGERLNFNSVRPIENRQGDGVHVGGTDENRAGNWDTDLSSQLVGGPRPGTKLAGASGAKDVPYDVTNQMYYADDTTKVKSAEYQKAKDQGQAPLEGYDQTNEAIMKGITTESEEHALKYAPKEPFRKEHAGTTWAT